MTISYDLSTAWPRHRVTEDKEKFWAEQDAFDRETEGYP